MSDRILRSSRPSAFTFDYDEAPASPSTITTGITSYILGDLRREANARRDERERRNAWKDFESSPTAEWHRRRDSPRDQERRVQGTETRNLYTPYSFHQQCPMLEDAPDMTVSQRDSIDWIGSDSSMDTLELERAGTTGIIVNEQSAPCSSELSESETAQSDRENYCVSFPPQTLGRSASSPSFSSSSHETDHDPFYIPPGFHAITAFSPYTNSSNMITRPHEVDCQLPSSPLESRLGTTKSNFALPLTYRNDIHYTEIDKGLDYQTQIPQKSSPTPSPIVMLGRYSRVNGDGKEEDNGRGGDRITTPDLRRRVRRDTQRIPLSSGRRVRVRNGILKLLAI